MAQDEWREAESVGSCVHLRPFKAVAYTASRSKQVLAWLHPRIVITCTTTKGVAGGPLGGGIWISLARDDP